MSQFTDQHREITIAPIRVPTVNLDQAMPEDKKRTPAIKSPSKRKPEGHFLYN